jgi:hypothetical protein
MRAIKINLQCISSIRRFFFNPMEIGIHPDITTIIMRLNSDEWNETVGAYLALDLLSNRIVLCGKEALSRARSYKIAEAKAPLEGVN